MDARKLVLPAAVFVRGALLGRLIGLRGLARANAGKRAPARRALQKAPRKRSAPKRSTARKPPSKSAGVPAGARTH